MDTNRLTEYREDLKRYEYKEDEKGYCWISEGQIVKKLGKLEDLEEKLGCPLDVVIKAIYSGVAYETKDGLMESEPYVKLYYDGKWFGLDIGNKTWAKINPDYFKLSDYKKTWWLKETKEE